MTKMESNCEPNNETSDKSSTDESNESAVNSMLKLFMTYNSVEQQMTAICVITDSLRADKALFFELRDFYHYFAVLAENAIEEQLLMKIEEPLSEFYRQIMKACYDWKCLADNYENDFRWFNCIQCLVKSITEKLINTNADNNIVNKCIPLVLSSMIVIVTTNHSLKEVALITRPIGDMIVDRRRRALNISSDEWKMLCSLVLNVSNIWAMLLKMSSVEKLDCIRFSKAVLSLFDYALGRDQFIRHITRKSIKFLSNEKRISLSQLFIEYQFEISSHILSIINIGSNFEITLLYESMSLFGITSLPHELLRHIVPHFAVKCDDKTRSVIDEIAKIDDNSPNFVLKKYLNDIMRQLFYGNNCQKSAQNIEDVVLFLSSYCNYDLKYRIKRSAHELVNSFLLVFAKDRNSTLEGLALIYCYQKNINALDLKYFYNNEEELRSYLKQYFLPFIHKLDGFMMNCAITNREKMTAIDSFVQLIQFMGKECINAFRVKIFSTIKLIISEKFYSNTNLIKSGIEVLMQFIKLVDDSYLSSQLLTISALILPLMHFWPIETSNLFKELTINRKSSPQIQSAFKHLYFIPEMQELSEVTKVLNPYISYNPFNEEEICTVILLVVSNINHENSKVQQFSLIKLRELLKKHTILLYKSCNDIKQENCDSFVNQIILNLMFCLKSTDNEVLSLVAECLGILGAIDPTRIDLDKPIISKEEICELFFNSSEKNFKIKLITLLMRAITTSAKKDDQYCASFALQEVLKIFTNTKTENFIDINTDLPQELRDYCSVLQMTRYHNAIPFKSSQEITEVIFGSNPDLTYNEWLKRWITSLFYSYIFRDEGTDKKYNNDMNAILSQSSNSQLSGEFDRTLENTLAKQLIPIDILNACYFAMLRNQSLAQFLLPYVVITSLKNATIDQRQIIVNEVKAIISKLTTDGTLFSGEIGHLSSQTVFHLFDHLKVWFKNRTSCHRNVAKTPRLLRAAQMKDREFKGVKFFLENISSLELATLAFKCNAFSRSLRYLEDYVKEKNIKSGALVNSFEEEIPFFQRIFIRLDEPDSVEGCNSKRINNPSIEETILTHEACGQIQEALICCAKAVQIYPNDFQFQEKYLQLSMDSFDQSEMVYTYGTGLMIKKPEWRRKLAPYVIEAVWKLGSWDQLDKLLEEHQNNSLTTFGSGIGALFCSIIQKRGINECEDKFMSLRRQLVGPLSAAAMEISGYVRGHQYIVDLHILNDIQTAYNKLITELNEELCDIENFKNRFSKLVEIWDERNNMVRKTIKCQEPILNTQRALLSILVKECDFLLPFIKKELFKSWVMSTKTSRKSGNIQRSYNCLLEMNKSRESLTITDVQDMPLCVTQLTDIEKSEAIVEAAKVHWARNDRIGAIKYLKDEIEKNFSDSRRSCYLQAINSLSDNFSQQDISQIANSLKITLDIQNKNYSSSTCSSSKSSVYSTLTSSRSDNAESHVAFARLQLLYTKYSDQFGALSQNTLALMYKSVTIADPNWEESHYSLGMYCYKIYNNYEESQRNSKSYSLGKPEEILELKGRVVKSLTESLKHGVKHAHNSLPRLLNIWFDLGSELYSYNNKSRRSSVAETFIADLKKTLDRITKAIDDLVKEIPSFIFFTSFAQLTSRILHPNLPIAKSLKAILSKLIRDFPQQSMWLLIRSINSSNVSRRACSQEILCKAIKEDQNEVLKKFIPDICQFAKLLNAMCERNPDQKALNSRNRATKVRQMSFKKDFPELDRLFSKGSNFSPILLPFHALLNVTLPTSTLNKNHNPFPSRDIYIRNFDDCIELLNSLQKPKKIKIYGNDGKTYTILCKPGDDLRKDQCFIEFSNLMNRCFKRDPQTRKRQLRVKTYIVVPLSDSGGLIEWIPGLIPYRATIEAQYRNTCDYDDIRDIVIRNWPNLTVPKTDRVNRFLETLPKFMPSVLPQWFITNYSDPLSWFSARLSYSRSSAVFSVVGYLLGLGDRHGENIMIDESSGETVHVDFNCLFNKGEDFQYPEKVPFRLTHNMVNAMGITEFEGTFRKACEHTLRIARDNKEAFMNFVTPFRFDHLYEWSRRESDSRNRSQHEWLLEHGERIVFNVEARLNGIPSRNDSNLPKGISLSVEGQVDHIIKEAIDVQNLGVMYVGWTPYL